VLFGTGTGMWIPGVANVAMRDVPPGLSGTASGVFNASRQVGTSIGLAILGGIGADAATSAWTSQAANLPGSARRAAIGQARNVASARISSVTRALGRVTGQPPNRPSLTAIRWQSSSQDLASSPPRSSPHWGYATPPAASWTQPQASLYHPATPPSHTPLSSHDLMEGTIMSIIEDIQRRSAHIHWPQGIVPEQADLFAHNDIVIAAPPGKIWEHLIHATGWPDWYSNASDVTVNASSGLLGAGVTFDWITFGAHIHSTVHEFEPAARIGWYGETDQWLAYHTWLLEPRDEGTTYVVMEETGSGLNPKKLAGSNPGHMHRGHDLWNISLKFLCESTQD